MISKSTAEKIEVMEAYSEGCRVEVMFEGNGTWYNCYPSWNWIDNDYRVSDTGGEYDEFYL